MGRIPEAELERLKREIAVERLAKARGVQLASRGEGRIGRCPFHDDCTSSLVITPAKNLWHCLGACQAGGGPIDWVMRAEEVSFRSLNRVEFGRPLNQTIHVGGRNVTYTAYRLPDGVINVGRIIVH